MTWSSWFRINSRMVPRLKVGRLLLGGDAAHIHSPAGAQGMNTGIQDMINLCWKLALVAKGAAPETLLDTYEQDRLIVAGSGHLPSCRSSGSPDLWVTRRPMPRGDDVLQAVGLRLRPIRPLSA